MRESVCTLWRRLRGFSHLSFAHYLSEADKYGHGWVRPLVCLVYLDEIIFHLVDFPTHLDRLRLLFYRLLVTRLKLKVSHCMMLHVAEGFFWTQNKLSGVGNGPREGESVRKWPTLSRCLKYVRSFFISAYIIGSFLGSSPTAAPLHALTKKNKSFVWDPCQDEFKPFKERLSILMRRTSL